LPVMEEVGTVEMPVFARMTKLPAVLRSTTAIVSADVAALTRAATDSNKRFNFMIDLD
jgi:hypothetical protein